MKRLSFILAVCLILAARLLVVLVPGNALNPPWSGGGDTERYVTLASNVLMGRGLSYGGHPTAFRSPLYVYFVAGAMKLAGSNWPMLVRLLQFAAGFLVAVLLARAGQEILGGKAEIVLIAVLACPTLIYVTSTIQTETLASLILAAYLVCCLKVLKCGTVKWGIFGGLALGIATLLRWIAPVLVVPGIYALCLRRSWRTAAAFVLAGILVLVPWLVRNWMVFGDLRLSTLGGLSLLQGITDPSGRAASIASDTERTKVVLGFHHADFEVNERDPALPDEKEAGRRAVEVWRALLQQESLQSLAWLAVQKLGWYWLSLEHLDRWERAVMVVVWWAYLVAAGGGFVLLCFRSREYAVLFAFWMLTVTVAQLPFCMNTRLRVPFMDGSIALLAALAISWWKGTDEGGYPIQVGERPGRRAFL